MVLRHWQFAVATSFLVLGSAAGSQVRQGTGPVVSPQVRQPTSVVSAQPETLSVRSPEPSTTPKRRSPTDDLALKVNTQLLAKSAGNIYAQRIADAIKQRLDGKSIGFSLTIILQDGSRGYAHGGLARSKPDSGQRGWKSTDRLSIASVSKMITAAAVRKALLDKNIPLDAKAWKYLPAGWAYGDNFKDITIEQMLAHTSGIRSVDGCDIYFSTLKTCAEMGIKLSDKTYSYDNANYGFMRLILPALYGNPANTEADTAAAYIWLVNHYVLKPAGIAQAGCKPVAGGPLSYETVADNGKEPGEPGVNATANFDFSAVKAGTDWGDMTFSCGSQGWNLSSDDLAKFAWALNQTDKIMPLTDSSVMRTNNLGMVHSPYPAGYSSDNHGGWHPAGWSANQGEVNSWAATVYGPKINLSVGLVVNSRYRGSYEAMIINGIREVIEAP